MLHRSPKLRTLRLITLGMAGAWPLFGQVVISGAGPSSTPPQTTRVDRDFDRTPLSFEPSGDGDSSFLARGNGYSVRLDLDGALLRLGSGDVVRMKLDGANPVKPSARDRLPGTVNYFIGNDSQRWRCGVPTYGKIAYRGVYSGVDLVYYGNRRALEYDLVVAPQASVKSIRLQFTGARISRENNGDLKILAPHGAVAFHQPVAYQLQGTTRRLVHARFVKISDTEVAFAVDRYNRNQPLIIDPQIVYSTYFNDTTPLAIAVDSAGSAYITGIATEELPVTSGAFQTADPGGAKSSAAFVAKLSPDGQSLVYSTYIGGTRNGPVTAIAVDNAGNAYLTGSTDAPDFPVTPGVFQTANTHPYGYSTGFLLKLNPSGTGLVYSTFLGGTGPTNEDTPSGVAVDANGDAFVTGSTHSLDFPVTAGAFQSTNKAAVHSASNIFVTKFNRDATALLYSTYLGGSGVAQQGYLYDGFSQIGTQITNPGGIITTIEVPYKGPPPTDVGDTATGIALDKYGDAYVVGNSASLDYPTTPGAFRTTNPTNLPSRVGPGNAPVVTKLNPMGTALLYSTYLGGSGTLWDNLTQQTNETRDTLNAIAVDPVTGNAYVAGNAGSSDYPVAPGALQAANLGIQSGAFLFNTSVFSELNSAGTGLVYSTYFGGSVNEAKKLSIENDTATGVVTDGNGNAYITGYTYALDFPVTSGAFEPTFRAVDNLNFAGSNAYFAVFNTATSQLSYSTYLGGSIGDNATGLAVDTQGNAYLVGYTSSSDFPITPSAFQTAQTGSPSVTSSGFIIYPEAGFITKIGVGAQGKILTRSVLAFSQSTSDQSGQITLTATVTPLTIALAHPILTGTVTFFNSGSPLGPPVPVGSPVTAASQIATLGTGPISLTCSYSGDNFYANSDCAQFPDFGIVLASPTVTVQSGQHITTSVTIFSIGGFADTIGVACGKVAYTACQFTPALTPLAANGSATLTLDLDTASAVAQNRLFPRSPVQLAFLLLPVSLLASRRLRRTGTRFTILAGVLALSLATIALSGCGQLIYPFGLPAGTLYHTYQSHR